MQVLSNLIGNARRLLLTAAVCVAASLLLSCDAAGTQKTKIRFWDGFTGPDGRTMLRLIKRFNKENPDIEVTMQRMDWPVYYNKLFVAGLGNRAPEVFVVHYSSMERFLQANFLKDIDDFTSGPNGIPPEDFSPKPWQAVEQNGRHYGIPLDVHMVGTYFNKKLLREAGIVDQAGEPRVPMDRDGFVDALVKLTKSKSADGREQYGFAFTWLRTNTLTVMFQYGGKLFTDDKTKCLLDGPENVAALQWCVDLINKHKVAPAPQNLDSWIGFRQGRVAMVWEGIYMLADAVKQKDLEYGAAAVPQIGKTPATWADSHVMCLRARLDKDKEDASWRLMKFLSDNSLDWAEGGQVPTRMSLLETERFKNMEIQYEFSKQLPIIAYIPRIPFAFEFYSEIDLAVEAALRGSLTPQEALSRATVNVNKVIERRKQEQAAAKDASK